MVGVDLATVTLPFLDEPHHPKLGRGRRVCRIRRNLAANAMLDELARLTVKLRAAAFST